VPEFNVVLNNVVLNNVVLNNVVLNNVVLNNAVLNDAALNNIVLNNCPVCAVIVRSKIVLIAPLLSVISVCKMNMRI
jgi:uncharacterized protein YjbI with pentapeptide repeats